MKDSTKRVSRCPICSASSPVFSVSNSMFGYASNIVECGNCGFAFLENQLPDAALQVFYSKHYREMKSEKLTRMRFLQDKERSDSQFDFWSFAVDRHSKVLEIGSGWGVNANCLHEKGFTKLAVSEHDDKACVLLNGQIRRVQGSFCDVKDKFDFIILSNVLEHLYDLNGKIAASRRSLTRQGKIFVEVPNIKSEGVRSLSETSYHYWFFTLDNACTLFRQHGFDVVKCGVFGKDKWTEELTAEELTQWETNVENGLSSFFEMNEHKDRAYYSRLLVSLRTGETDPLSEPS